MEAPVEDLIKSAAQEEPKLAPLLIPDRIHPAEAAQWVMALAVIKAWHVTPIVSTVDLDASAPAIKSAQRTRVSALSSTPSGLAWDQLDEALPLPLSVNDPVTQMVLRLTDLAAFDKEMLYVRGLPAVNYKITIDGWKTIGPFWPKSLPMA